MQSFTNKPENPLYPPFSKEELFPPLKKGGRGDFLKSALELATTRRGFCAPNPAVGALVVKNEKIVGTGYHHGPGYPHAEVEALKDLDDETAKGATLYVTLEPCCHWGKTPPCTDLLIKKKIAHVIYGFDDPNPQVAGRGVRLLREAGISCEHYEVAEINDFYVSYFFWWKTGRPFATAKLAFSLDGKTAAEDGSPVKITGDETNHLTHQYRKTADALLTTAKTIVCDDPRLDARLPEGHYAKPIYVIDSKLTMALNARVLITTSAVTVFHEVDAPPEKLAAFTAAGIRCVAVKHEQQGLNLEFILQYIGKEGVHDLWIEAGRTCFQSFARQQLLQKAFIYVAPIFLGSPPLKKGGQGGFSAPDCEDLHELGEFISAAKSCHESQQGQDTVYEMRW